MPFVRTEHANTLVFGLYQCLIVETPVSLFHFVLWLWDFICFHEMKWNLVISMSINLAKFDPFHCTSCHPMPFYCFHFVSEFFLFSISFHQFLPLSLHFTSFSDFGISMSIILAGLGPFHCKETTPHCPNIAPSTPFFLAPPMCWAAQQKAACTALLWVRLEKPQIPELQGHCNYKRHAKGSTVLPQHCSLHTFLLGTTLVFGTSAKGCSIHRSPFHVLSHLFA